MTLIEDPPRKVVRQYPIEIQHGPQELVLSKIRKVVHVAVQNERINLWVQVQPDAPEEPVQVFTVDTDESVPPGTKHAGSVAIKDGAFVWHVYVEKTASEMFFGWQP